MNYSKMGRWLGVSHLMLALPLVVLNCSDNDDSAGAGVSAGAGGADAGGAGADHGDGGAAAPPVLICGGDTELSECDPVTATGCDVAAGATCDHSADLGGFKCFPDSTAKAGEFCDNETAFCGAHTYCNTDLAVCQHYCCDGTGCADKFCDRGYFVDGNADVGLCLGEFGGRCLYGLGGAGGDCAGGAAGSDGTGNGGAGGAGGDSSGGAP